MRRGLAMALLPLALGGCLPLPIAVASSAFSGISYLTSGKSTSDHVLSATMDKDCALTRPVIGEPFCRDIGPAGEGRTAAVIVAHYPGDWDGGLSNDERRALRSRGALDLTAASDDVQQVAVARPFLPPPPRVSVAGIIVTKDQIVPAPQTRTLPIATDTSWSALVPVRTIEVAPLAAPIRSVTTPVELPSATAHRASVPQAGIVTPAAAVEQPGAIAATPAAVARKPVPGAAGADRWVIVGSFRDVERAKVMARRLSERAPTILAATVDGGQWHRVAIGPLTSQDARSVRDGLGRVEGRLPWVIRADAR